METIVFTPSTAVLLAIIMALAVFALRRLISKGLCDCKADKGSCKSCRSCSSCRHACDRVHKV